MSRLSCNLNDPRLPCVPPLKINVRSDYPFEPPIVVDLSKDYGESMQLNSFMMVHNPNSFFICILLQALQVSCHLSREHLNHECCI